MGDGEMRMLAISECLRTASLNRALLRAMPDLAPAGCVVGRRFDAAARLIQGLTRDALSKAVATALGIGAGR